MTAETSRPASPAAMAVQGPGRQLVAMPPHAPVAPQPPARRTVAPRRLLLAAALLLAATASAAGGWYVLSWQQRNALPAGIVSSNGRIEAEQIDVATKAAGRVEAVLVEEGDMVRAGQIVARMDSRELEAALRQAEAQARQAGQALEARRAVVQQYRSQLALAQAELDRTTSLVPGGHTTRQLVDQRIAARDAASATLNAAAAQSAEAEQAVAAAGEAVERVRSQLADTVLTAPVDGRVQYRLANPGEVLGAGGRVVTLLDVSNVSMTVFLPTGEAGRLPLGSEARLVLDALPQLVIPATVSFVSPQAQFTPRSVETRSERERLMFRVKLRIPAELLRRHADDVRTGLPGIGYVRLDPALAWPARLEPGTRAR